MINKEENMLYIFIADGFEEVEAIAAVDVIRRGGIKIETVAVGTDKTVTGTHGMTLVCDRKLSEISLSDELDGIILPGGMPGTVNLLENSVVDRAIDFCRDTGRLICAICAAPMILGRKGLLKGKKAVCFPGFEDELVGAVLFDGFVCTDENIITAKGMGCAVDFGLAIVAKFKGKSAADTLKAALQCGI